jgi:xanthine/uracil permease
VLRLSRPTSKQYRHCQHLQQLPLLVTPRPKKKLQLMMVMMVMMVVMMMRRHCVTQTVSQIMKKKVGPMKKLRAHYLA